MSNQTRSKADRRQFTEQNVLTLRARKGVKGQFQVWDAGTDAARGLSILGNTLTGTKSYRATFYFIGSPKPHSMHLGRVGEISLEHARKLTREARGKARAGDDPKADAPGYSDSLASAIESYIKNEQIGRQGNKSAEQTRGVMERGLAPLLRRPVATIRYQEIDRLLCSIRDGDPEKGVRARPYLANRLFSHVTGLFGWCVRSRILSASPIVGMKLPWEGAKPRNRDWFSKKAADEAIKSLWRAADSLDADEGRYLKMMILIGKRREHLTWMHWEQIDADWFWDAPPGSKIKRLHAIPLPSLAQRVLHPRRAEGPVFGIVAADGFNFDAAMERIRKLSGVEDFIFQGLRHLVETKTAELRVPPHIRDALFDHASKRGAGGGYDHHEYREEMLGALELWAAHVEALVSPQGARLLR